MKGRPRSAVRTAPAVAAVSASTEFLERGAMVGSGRYSLAENTSLPANALQLPAPLELPQQPAATSPLTSPAPPTPGPPIANAADLRAQVAALDESRDLTPSSPAPSTPAGPAHPPGLSPDPIAPASPYPLAAADLEPAPTNLPLLASGAPVAEEINRSFSPVRSSHRSTSPGPGPVPGLGACAGSLKLFSSGTANGIGRGPSPGPSPGLRSSLTLFPGGGGGDGGGRGAAAAGSPDHTARPNAPHLTVDSAATSPPLSPSRLSGWVESVYSPKARSVASGGLGGNGPCFGTGPGPGPGPDGAVGPVCRSPVGSPLGRHQRATGVSYEPVAPSSSSPSSSPGRAMTALQYVYGSMPQPQPPPVVVVASATADCSSTTKGTGSDGGGAAGAGDAAPNEPPPMREGPKAYYVLSPPSLSSSAMLAATVAAGSSPSGVKGTVTYSGVAERSGGPAATSANLSATFSCISAVYPAAATSPVRQPVTSATVLSPAVHPTRGDAGAGAADVATASSHSSIRHPPFSPSSRSIGVHSSRSMAPAPVAASGPSAGPGPGSAALATATANTAAADDDQTSPAAGRASPAGSCRSSRGPCGGSPDAARSVAGTLRSQSATAATRSDPQQQQQQPAGGGFGWGRRWGKGDLFEEDPAVVLEQSIALLSEIEGHIRSSVRLAPDHPLQSIRPELAVDIPLQLVEALEDTLEIIAMARLELARDKATDRDRDRDRDRERDRDRGSRPPWQAHGVSGAPTFMAYRSGGGGGGGGRLSRSGSQPGYGSAGGGGGSDGASRRSSRGSWTGAGGGGGGGAVAGSQLPPISTGGGGGGGGTSSRGGLPLYGRPSSQQQPSRPSSQQQQHHPYNSNHHHHYNNNPPPPRAVSASRRTSGTLSGGGGGGGGGSVASVPSLAATISSRRAWHREPPSEEWVAAKLARADAERRKREAQLAADLRYLQQMRSRAAEVQQTHEALLAQSEEAVRAARSAKAASEAQHRWLHYQDTVAEGARRHFDVLMAQQQQPQQQQYGHAHEAYGATSYRGYS